MFSTIANIGVPFIPSTTDLKPFSAELWLIATIVAVLIAPFFTRKANFVCGCVALAGFTIALLTQLIVGAGADVTGEHLRGLLVFDPVAHLWKILLLVFAIGVVGLWFATTSRQMHLGDGPEFFTLLLGATLGMSLMAEAGNLLTIFLAIETASLPSYVLAGFRKTHRVGAEASLKYVLFGAAASSIMVYGMSLLYGLVGSVQLSRIAAAMAQPTGPAGPNSALLVVAVFGIVVGVGFKISAVPFHFWCPDVFEGSHVDVTTFLSVASKGAGLVLLLRIAETFAAAGQFHAGSGVVTTLAAVIGTLGAITATVGNTAAYVQTNLKRLLAYSSIAHAGYMLCAVSIIARTSASSPGFDPSAVAAQALLLYLAVYLFMNLGAFAVVASVQQATGRDDLAGFRALGRRSPMLAGCMFCCLVSLIGLPPFGGFVAKLNLIGALTQAGGWWWVLVAVVATNTVVSAFYYFRVIRAMYLEPGDGEPFAGPPAGVAISLACALMLVVMLLGFGPLSRVASRYDTLFLPAENPAPVVTMSIQ